MSADKDEEQQKIDDIVKRAEKLRASTPDEVFAEKEGEEEISPEAKKSARAGSEFLANIFAGAILGYGIDWYFETLPWGMIFFIIMGFISGVYRANAAMKESYKENDE